MQTLHDEAVCSFRVRHPRPNPNQSQLSQVPALLPLWLALECACENALAICAKHAAFHLTNSSAFRIQLRNWKISVWWELFWYITTVLGFLCSASQPCRPLRISSLSYGIVSFQSLQTEIKTWKYLSPWHSQDTKCVDLGPDQDLGSGSSVTP